MTTTKPDRPIRTHDPVHAQRTQMVIFVVAALIALAIGVLLPSDAERVDVTISNPTDYRLYISATTPDDATRSFVAITEPRTTRVANVIDRGADWTLHVQSSSNRSATVTATRDELTSGAYAIPVRIGDDFGAAGVVPDERSRANATTE